MSLFLPLFLISRFKLKTFEQNFFIQKIKAYSVIRQINFDEIHECLISFPFQSAKIAFLILNLIINLPDSQHTKFLFLSYKENLSG